MLDREVFSCIPFQLVSSQICLSLSFARKLFPFAKNLFWNWSLNSAVKFFFCKQLVLYTGFICSATSVRIVFWQLLPHQILFNHSNWISDFRMYVTFFCQTYLQDLWRYVDVRKYFFFFVAKQCEAQRGTVTPGFERIFSGLFYDVVAYVIIVRTL